MCPGFWSEKENENVPRRKRNASNVTVARYMEMIGEIVKFERLRTLKLQHRHLKVSVNVGSVKRAEGIRSAARPLGRESISGYKVLCLCVHIDFLSIDWEPANHNVRNSIV